MIAAIVVLKVPLYIQRSMALMFAAGAIVFWLYGFSSTAGLEWFIPFLFIKLLVSHLTRDEPYIAPIFVNNVYINDRGGCCE